MKRSGMILLVLITLFKLQAQELSYREYNTNHGMAQNQIVAWMQDRDGYIWFGHKGGLSRFDGANFERFYQKDGLPDIFISTITQCSDGKIYVLTRKGFALFDGDKFIPYPHEDDVLFFVWLGNEFITTCLNDGWIYTQGSGEKLLFKDGEYFPFDTLFPGVLTEKMMPYWFSECKSDFLYRNNGELWIYKDEKHKPVFLDNTVIVWFESGWNETVGVQDDERIYLFNRNTLELDTVFDFSYWRNGSVNYIDDELNIYGIETPNILHIFNNNGDKQSYEFSVPYISSVFRDREHNLWIMGETGVMMLQSEAFRNYTKMQGSPDYVWTIVEDIDGGIWLASYGQGLFHYVGKEFSNVRVEGLPQRWGDHIFYKGAIRDKSGRLWFPHTHGVVKVENRKAQFQNQIPDVTTLYAYQDPYNNDIYFAQVGQVSILQNDNKVDVLKIQPANKPGLILSLVKDTLQRLWIGGPYGISILDGDEVIYLPSDEIPFSDGAVSMATDHKGNIWIGNRSGLFFYNYKEVRKIQDKNLFLDKYVTDLKVAGSDGLYIGMVGGIAWLDLETFYSDGFIDLDFFDHTNGFLGREALQNGSFFTSDGTIWISATDRVVQFDPSKRKNRNRSQPNIIIRSISNLNESMEWKSIDLHVGSEEPNVLNYYQKHLRFDFAGITMVNPENVKYRYKLKGLSDEWSAPTMDRNASFTNLSPGKYTFMVDVSNAEGIWTENPAVISFVIRNAWWQTAGFQVLSAILIIMLVLGAVYLVLFKIRQSQMKDISMRRHIAELKLEAIKAQVDPHFVFNVLSSIGSSIYNNRKEEAYTSLTRFSRLIRKAFEGNEKPFGELSTEISFTENYLELQKQRFKDAFDYKIHVDPAVPDNAQLPRLLLQTLTENAIKHGVLPAGTERIIEINVDKKADHYEIIVEDNGVGRQQPNPGENGSTGRGLQIARQLFDIFNQFNDRKITFDIVDKYNHDQSSAGTKVIVFIPFDFQFEIPEART